MRECSSDNLKMRRSARIFVWPECRGAGLVLISFSEYHPFCLSLPIPRCLQILHINPVRPLIAPPRFKGGKFGWTGPAAALCGPPRTRFCHSTLGIWWRRSLRFLSGSSVERQVESWKQANTVKKKKKENEKRKKSAMGHLSLFF